jgi:hypothetical protein
MFMIIFPTSTWAEAVCVLRVCFFGTSCVLRVCSVGKSYDMRVCVWVCEYARMVCGQPRLCDAINYMGAERTRSWCG